MPVTLNFGDRRYEVNHTRIARLLSSDKKEALYMGLWDRFKELFRTHKKKRLWKHCIRSSTDAIVKSKLNLALM